MKSRKKITPIILAFLGLLMTHPCAYAASSSQEFKIVVHIPAVPGVNTLLNGKAEKPIPKQETLVSFYSFTEEIQQAGRTVIRETIVAR